MSLWETSPPAAAGPSPEAKCGRCGEDNVVWYAPSPLWNQVMRGGDINGAERYGGVVCPTCFALEAEQAGVATMWKLTAERVHVELQTVTPSGRVWDDVAMRWVDPLGPCGPGCQCGGPP